MNCKTEENLMGPELGLDSKSRANFGSEENSWWIPTRMASARVLAHVCQSIKTRLPANIIHQLRDQHHLQDEIFVLILLHTYARRLSP